MDPTSQAETILALRPMSSDYRSVWGDTYGPLLEAQLEPLWAAGKIRPAPWTPEQTELRIASATRAEFERKSGESSEFPRGYQRIIEFVSSDARIYAFRFVRPGEKSGASWDGLVHVEGHWRLFPKAWRAAQEGSPVYRPNSVESVCKALERLPAGEAEVGAKASPNFDYDACIVEMTPRAQELGVGGFSSFSRCVEGLAARSELEHCQARL